MVKTFTEVHKMPRYLLIYYKISFIGTVYLPFENMIEQNLILKHHSLVVNADSEIILFKHIVFSKTGIYIHFLNIVLKEPK